MSESWKHSLSVAALGGLLLLANLGGAALFDEDEPKNAACAQEMLARGDYLVPWFNGELRTDKPILLYWLMLCAYQLGGVNEFTARVVSALCGVGTAVVTYHLGRTLFRASVGLWAAVVLLTCLMFEVVARAATPDSLFILLMTSAFLVYARGAARAAAAAPEVSQAELASAACRPARARDYVAMYALLGMAALAKGPAGIVLPLAALFLFGLLASVAAAHLAARNGRPAAGWRSWWADFRSTSWPSLMASVAWSLRPFLAVAVLAVVVLPWYLAVGRMTDGEWLRGFLGHHNLGRFTQPLEGHRGPFVFYYVAAIVIGMFPWSIFFPQAALELRRSLVERDTRLPAMLFLACWAAVVIGVFSLARTKLPNYVLPAYPALALIVGVLVDRWVRRPKSIRRRLMTIALASYALVGVGMIVGIAAASWWFFPGDAWLAAIGLIPLAGGLAAWRFQRHFQTAPAALSIAASAVLLALAMFGVAGEIVGRRQTSPLVAELARRRGDAPLVTYEFFEPSLVFYHGRPVRRFHDAEQVAAALAADPRACLVTKRDRLAELEGRLPEGMVEIAARMRFLRNDEEVVVLARPIVSRVAETRAIAKPR